MKCTKDQAKDDGNDDLQNAPDKTFSTEHACPSLFCSLFCETPLPCRQEGPNPCRMVDRDTISGTMDEAVAITIAIRSVISQSSLSVIGLNDGLEDDGCTFNNPRMVNEPVIDRGVGLRQRFLRRHPVGSWLEGQLL